MPWASPARRTLVLQTKTWFSRQHTVAVLRDEVLPPVVVRAAMKHASDAPRRPSHRIFGKAVASCDRRPELPSRFPPTTGPCTWIFPIGANHGQAASRRSVRRGNDVLRGTP